MDAELEADPPAELPVDVVHVPFFHEDEEAFAEVEAVVRGGPRQRVGDARGLPRLPRALPRERRGRVRRGCARAGGRRRRALHGRQGPHRPARRAAPARRRRRRRADRRRLRAERGAAAAAARGVARRGGDGGRARADPAHRRHAGRVDARRPRRSSSGATGASRPTFARGGVERRRPASSCASGCVADAVLAIYGPTASGKTAVAEALTRADPGRGRLRRRGGALPRARGAHGRARATRRGSSACSTSSTTCRSASSSGSRTRRSTTSSRAGERPSSSAEPVSICARRCPTSSCRRRPQTASRERWEAFYDEHGGVHAHGRLQTLDPEAAARVHPNDRRRVVRALELAEAGSSLAGDDLWSGETRRPTLVFGLDVPDDVLEQRIRARADSMLERGVVDEARAALARPLSRSASKVMGLVGLRRAAAGGGARGAGREQPAARALPAQVDAADPGSRRARRRIGPPTTSRPRSWRPRVARGMLDAVIKQIGERGLGAAARRAPARARRRSRGVPRDVENASSVPGRAGGASARRRPSGRRPSASNDDGRFDGLVSCFVADDPATVFLVAMWVAPELRGTGAARELVESRRSHWAREHGAARVCLSVEGDNDRARRASTRSAASSRRRSAAVPVRAESRQPLLRVRALTMERWHAHGNVYLVTEEPLDAERVRRDVGDADGIVAGRRRAATTGPRS